VSVTSAGTHAQVGRSVLPAVLAACATIGDGAADRELVGHLARQIDIVMARESDLILCATAEHRQHLLAWWPELGEARVRLFNEAIAGQAPVDVDDPYGWDRDVFELAARVIDRAMAAWASASRGNGRPTGPEWTARPRALLLLTQVCFGVFPVLGKVALQAFEPRAISSGGCSRPRA
jgi:protein-tyrosine-phosphatase